MASWTTLAGAGGLVVREGRLLLVRQSRPYGVHWELPSGYCEPGESFEEATAREVLEETGIAVDVGALVCTMLWEREHDRRRNLLAVFVAVAQGTSSEPRPQTDEEIEAAAFLDPRSLRPGEIHPLHEAVLDRWWNDSATGFHLSVDVVVREDGTQDYLFR